VPKHTTPDEGLELIARYESAIIEARMQRLQGTGLDPAAVARERADVTGLAATIAERLRADYRARTRQ
jgi:hypothetical protein